MDMFPYNFKTSTLAIVLAGTLVSCVAVNAAAKAPHGTFKPDVSIVPNVFEPDGQTLRTYETPTGSTYWSPNLPVKPGDKLVLKVFATTGGVELSKLIVRLDNVKIAEPTSSPWIATVDTTTLAQGSHMIEVWAEAGGNPSKAKTKTFSFIVATPTPVMSSTLTSGSAVVEPDAAIGSTPPGPMDPLPAFLAGKPLDEASGVVIRSQDAEIDGELTSADGSVIISMPTLLYCERSAGSHAVQYAYSITRGDKVVVQSQESQSLDFVKIRLQPLAENKTGLLPGKVTLWVWGIDKAGHPSNAVHRDFVIGASGQ